MSDATNFLYRNTSPELAGFLIEGPINMQHGRVHTTCDLSPEWFAEIRHSDRFRCKGLISKRKHVACEMKGQCRLANTLSALKKQRMMHTTFTIGLCQESYYFAMTGEIITGRWFCYAFNGIMSFWDLKFFDHRSPFFFKISSAMATISADISSCERSALTTLQRSGSAFAISRNA